MKTLATVCVLAAAVLLSTSVLSRPAFAYGSGTVTGTLYYYNNLGQYCPSSGRSCTGSNYNQAEFGSNLPFRDMAVALLVNGVAAGVGTTNSSGSFTINWYYPLSGTPTSATLEFYGRHKDGHFQIMDPDGTSHRFYWNGTVTYGGTANWGSQTWGSSGAANAFANAYAAAWRTWYYAFAYSTLLVAYLNDLEIWVNTSTGNTFFTPSGFHIEIDSSNLWEYFTMYHEMGHAASYKASSGQSFAYGGDYCYPSTGSCAQHSFTSQEWGAAQFEEGFATAIGNISQFWSSATDPYACFGKSNGACPADDGSTSMDLETSLFTSCTSADSRREINVAKYIRDLYDSSDVVNLSFSQTLGGVYYLASGTGEDQKDEPWNSGYTALDDRDGGRSAKDYQQKVDTQYNISSSDSAYLYDDANCSAVGD